MRRFFCVNYGNLCDQFLIKSPNIGERVFIAPNATVLGSVTLGARSSVFYNCVLRADINSIVVGEETNIQDSTVVHLSRKFPTIIGNRVTIGHAAIIHACTIGNDCLIGMGSIIMDGAVIGEGSIVAAGAIVTMGKQFESR